MIKIIKLNSVGQYIDNVFDLKNGELDNTRYIFMGVNVKNMNCVPYYIEIVRVMKTVIILKQDYYII